MGLMHWMTAATAAVAACVLGGCTFGDEAGQAQHLDAGWNDPNCVAVECLFECCQGWNYSKDPILHGGVVYGRQCDGVRTKNPAYSEYVALMLEDWNKCSSDFVYLESGYCEVVNPPDVIKEFGADEMPVYAGLSFPVCGPQGQKAAHPMDDVELVPQD
jgi:hypothetical protein